MSVVIGFLVLVAVAALVFNPLTLRLYYFREGVYTGEAYGLSGRPGHRIEKFYRCASKSIKCREAYDKGFVRGMKHGLLTREALNANSEVRAESVSV